jgi:hypothetical protein
LAGCPKGGGGGIVPPPPKDEAGAIQLAGCSPPGEAHIAPGGYYTSKATVCTSAGAAHLFHGVDRPSLEWSAMGVMFSADDFRKMAGWNANIVRIALNQDFWLSGAALHDPNYPAHVDEIVRDAEAAGLDVILDLHWSDRGNLGVTTTGKQNADDSAQQPMADVNSKQFWIEVATKYKGDGHVLFEMYNEPTDIPWDVWLHGGPFAGFTVVGMQDLYDAIRGVGADNVVIAGGLHWAYNLSAVGSAPITGYNVMYATHPYNKMDNSPSTWESSFGYLATNDIAPVIATEFGDFSAQCTGAWNQQLISFADMHRISWTAWAWFPSGCKFPSIIEDWSGAPTVQGAIVKNALAGYPKITIPDAGAPMDASADADPDASD